MRNRLRRSGQTMLELIAASIVIAMALVPALKLTRTIIANTKKLEHAEARLTLCTSKLEETLAQTAATWDMTPRSGSFPDLGNPNVHFFVTKSDQMAAGGLPGELAAIQVTVWHDDNVNGALDSDEQRVTLATKLARLASYENQSDVL